MREYVEITDVSISFGGVKLTGFADAAYIRYDDGELRRRRNKRKRRSRKQRGK